MNREKLLYYSNLLKQHIKGYGTTQNTEIDTKLTLKDEVDALVSKDADFEELLAEVEIEYLMRSSNKGTCLHIFRNYSKGESVKFDDRTLICFIDLYQNDLDFRKRCDVDEPDFQQTITSLLTIYHRKIVNDTEFTKQVLLQKLKRFTFGKLGLENFIEFNQAERETLIRLYYEDSEFREICDHHNVIVREMISSWLKKR